MKLKNILLCAMLFFLASCSKGEAQIYKNRANQSKPEVFFENIYIGDNLETCLAKGTVQYHINDLLQLANTNVAMSYFTSSEVRFDNNNIIKEIHLLFKQRKDGKTGKDVFNFMTQYFCQRYKGMKTEKFCEEKLYQKMKCTQDGMRIIWETDKMKIILKSYYSTPDYTPVIRKSENEVAFDWGKDIAEEIKGRWVELNIIAK